MFDNDNALIKNEQLFTCSIRHDNIHSEMSLKKSCGILTMDSQPQESKLKSELVAFIESRRVKKGSSDVVTHTSMPGSAFSAGSFHISGDDMNKFFELYNKHVFEEHKQCHLIERHADYGPIVIDLDFRYNDKLIERQHTDEHIKKFLEILYKEICNYFVFKKKDDELVAFIFQRDAPYQDKSDMKDGVHIMFPFIVSEPNVQYLIRSKVIKRLDEAFGDLPLKNSYVDVYDRTVIYRNGWFMHGSTKPNRGAYNLHQIYDSELDELDECMFDDEDFTQLFSIRNKSDLTIINQEMIEEIDEFHKKRGTNKANGNSSIRRVYDQEKIIKLVGLLSKDRADSEPSWIEVGWCLYNIDPNNEDLMGAWIEFSKKSSKFKEGECEKRWEKFHLGELGIGSLYYWAKQDNMIGYEELQREDLQGMIEQASSTNYDIAKIMYDMFGDRFKCASIKHNSWYEFKNHLWEKLDSGTSLRKKISQDLVKEYMRLISKYNQLASNSEDADGDEQDAYLKKAEKLVETTLKLKSTSFKDNVMKECRELFYDPTFLNNLDSNKYLMGFPNGVYDLQKHELRDGLPEDYVSKCCKVDCIPFNEEDDYVEEIKEYMKQVFPDPDVREYMWFYLCTQLQGHNAEEKFHIWTGCGANSKSKLLELLINTIGDYAYKFPITLLTGKRAASNAVSPEMVMAKGARFCYCEEPDEDTRINVGLMKEMTGNDMIFARGLYSDPIQFRPQFKLNLLCNQLPKVPPHDKGTWRRLRKVEFPSEFVEFEPKMPHQFPCDPYLSEKLVYWRETFMSMLLQYYKRYRSELSGKLVAPPAILEATAQYQRESDAYVEFLETHYTITHEPTDQVEFDEIYENFKVWYNDYYNSSKLPSKKEITKYLGRIYPPKWMTSRGTVKNIKPLIKKIKLDDADSVAESMDSLSKETYEEIKKKRDELSDEFIAQTITP